MRRSGGLTRNQIICIALLWVALCVMLFTLPSDNTLGENIFVAVFSGLIVLVAIKKDQDRITKRKREELNWEIKRMKDELKK